MDSVLEQEEAGEEAQQRCWERHLGWRWERKLEMLSGRLWWKHWEWHWGQHLERSWELM